MYNGIIRACAQMEGNPFPKGVRRKRYTVNSIRNVCLLGHSGSGKTALAESLLI